MYKIANFINKLLLIYADGEQTTDIGQEISTGINSALSTIRAIVNPIATVAVVACGIYLVSGQGDPQSVKKAKTWGITIFVGILIINLADKIVQWAQGIGA